MRGLAVRRLQDSEVRKLAVLQLLRNHQDDATLTRSDLDIKLGFEFEKIANLAKDSRWWGAVFAEMDLSAWEGKGIEEILSDLPILTRREVQEFGEQMRVPLPGLTNEALGVFQTSGSTGQPVTVLKHRSSNQIQFMALELLDAIWQNRNLRLNTAYFTIAPHDDERESFGVPFDYLGDTGRFFRRSLISNTVSELLDFMVEKDVKNFLLNPLVMRFLINEQLRNPRPGAKFDQALSWADRVDPELRKKMKEVFGAKICDRYSATEFGYIALQCPRADHLHALQFSNYVEILDNDGKRCEVGVPGRVVVTSLQNVAMPLIRYELGDIAAWDKECEHGIALPVLSPLIVRTREAIQLPDGSLEIPYIDDTELAKHPNVVDTQIYRFLDSLVVLYQADKELDVKVIDTATAQLRKIFVSAEAVELVRAESLAWLGVWKRSLVIPVDQKRPESLSLDFFKELKN
jgi:phenylacetate-CoA ligase